VISMSTTHERTAVTGAPRGLRPKRGQVVGERYEIRGRLRDDAFSYGLLAFDQETEKQVLLRVVRPELLPKDARGPVCRELQKAVGVGGKFLPGLLDADRDGAHVYVAEPVPEGACLRDVLDRRAARKRGMRPEEVLPVVAHLEAALAAIPPPLLHGDVRAENVWVDAERLQLTAPFIVPALPQAAVMTVLARDGELRRRCAPETGRGRPLMAAADRYGVASIAWEMLTLEAPSLHEVSRLGPVGDALESYLQADPAHRAGSLEPLVEALARAAGLSVPELEPGAFRSPRRPSLPRHDDEDAQTQVHRSLEAPLPGGTIPSPAGGAIPSPAATLEDDTTVPADLLAAARRSRDEATTAPDGVRRDTIRAAAAPPSVLEAATRVGPSPDEPTSVAPIPTAPLDDDGLPPPPEVDDDAYTQPRRASHEPHGAPSAPKAPPPPALAARRAKKPLPDPLADETTPMPALEGKDADAILAKRRSEPATKKGVPEGSGALDPRLVRAAKRRAEEAAHHEGDGDTEAEGAMRPPPSRKSRKPSTELDARLVRAAIGVLAEEADESTPSLDPRLVRAALDVQLEAEGGEPSSSEIDPRLLRAALDVQLEEDEPSSSEIDPRLLRAALGVTLEMSDERDVSGEAPPEVADAMSESDVPLDPSVPVQAAPGGTMEIGIGELAQVEEAAPGVPLDPSIPVEAAPGGTMELGLDQIEAVEEELDDTALDPAAPPPAAKEPTMEIGMGDLEQMEADRRRAAVPQAIKPVPRARRDSGRAPEPVLFDDSSGVEVVEAKVFEKPSEPPAESPSRDESPAARRGAHPAQDAPIKPGPRAPRIDPTDPRAARRKAKKRRRRNTGTGIVVVALVLGAMIITGALLFAAHKKSENAAERQQRLQERFEQIQNER